MVRNSYFAMCNTDLTTDLDAMPGFINVNQYPSQKNILESEWGAQGNVRFLISSIGSITPGASNLGANVYNIFVTGMQAYATVEQDGYSASFIYRKGVAVVKPSLIDLELSMRQQGASFFAA